MASLKEKYARENTRWRRWGALIVLVVFFFASWGGQFVSQMQVVKQENEQHGQQFSMDEFWPQFLSSTFENWQSEWLQLATQALLIAAFADYMFRKGNQDHYKTQLMIEELREEIRKKKT
jgi:hypothetical protein